MNKVISKINLPSKKQKFRSAFEAMYAGKNDEYGFDLEKLFFCEPFFRFFYEDYFEVKTLGIENIPDNGRAILIGNHSGVLPIDAFMTYTALLNLHPHPRRIRFLVHRWLMSTPGAGELIKIVGGVQAKYENAKKLLENEELVFFYPEGPKGTGKPFSMRYRLDDFDPGFVKAAIETQSPIIPITTIGGDEVFPLLGNLNKVARMMGAPYWPVTPTYPFFPFSISSMPLPIKLLIKVGKPIYFDYPVESAHDRKLRVGLAREIQYDIQRELNCLFGLRKSPFADWDLSSIQNEVHDENKTERKIAYG